MYVLRIFRRFYSKSDLIQEKKSIGKTALITGATRDIARVCINHLLENDLTNLIITDTHAIEGKDLAIDLGKKYPKTTVCFIRADLTRQKQVHDLFRSIESDFAQCDLIINSAVVYDEEQPQKMMEVNMGTVCNCMKFAIEHMSKSNGRGGGTIINVSSILGLEKLAHIPMFSATKSFIIGMTRSYGLPYHYERNGIRFMTLCPGMTVEELKKFNELARMELARFGKQKISFVGDCLIEMIKYGANGSLWTAERGRVYEMNVPHEMFKKKQTRTEQKAKTLP